MVPIAPELDPSDVGLDQVRLASIGRHFDRYVEDRRIPGFLAVVTRARQGRLSSNGAAFAISRAQAPSRPTPAFASTR